MKINISKPLIVFDLETTGLDLVNDRIIQISYIKIHPDGKEERDNIYLNPGKEIPHDVTTLTGISNDDVKDCPSFKDVASELSVTFRNCDLPVSTPITLIYRCWRKSFSEQASTLTFRIVG